MLSLAKKKKGTAAAATGHKKVKQDDNSDSDSSGSDMEWNSKAKGKKRKKNKTKSAGKRTARRSMSATYSSGSEDDEVSSSVAPSEVPPKKSSDLEEGEVSSSGDSDSSPDEFNDGYDDNLMGDEEDQNRLSLMTEKEREQELYKRLEQREVMRTRFEIEKKLRQAKKKEIKRYVILKYSIYYG